MVLALGALIPLAAAAAIAGLTMKVDEVRGKVLDQGQPVAGATVRIKATTFQTTTDAKGSFVLKDFPAARRVHVTAWAEGYYIGGSVASPGKRTLTINLARYATDDNPDYEWIPPRALDKSVSKIGCSDCHGRTIVDQWAGSAHAQGTANIRFMTMYNGTDVSGRRSPPTRYGFSRDYGRFPLKPNTEAPYYGPGFKLDFPDQPGNCASCHLPSAALAQPQGADINTVKGIDAQGSHCDFCHKIMDVYLEAAEQVPAENVPGVGSIRLNRPRGKDQMFFGPFDDIDVGPDTFSPLQSESRICAPCHNASFWGTPVYQSYAEWLASPYPLEGKTCQSCHMKPDGKTDNFAPASGGIKRDPSTIPTHTFPGASDIDLLQHTAKLELEARREGHRILVEAKVTNENAGHHIPTDHPMRNIILILQATDQRGNRLQQMAGPTVPEWGGAGSGPDDFASQPGKGYAKVLEELWTEVAPTAAYWRQTTIRGDTRIPARETDITRYEFEALPSDESVTVSARLLFRRAFKPLADLKGWKDPDIVMSEASVAVR